MLGVQILWRPVILVNSCTRLCAIVMFYSCEDLDWAGAARDLNDRLRAFETPASIRVVGCVPLVKAHGLFCRMSDPTISSRHQMESTAFWWAYEDIGHEGSERNTTLMTSQSVTATQSLFVARNNCLCHPIIYRITVPYWLCH